MLLGVLAYIGKSVIGAAGPASYPALHETQLKRLQTFHIISPTLDATISLTIRPESHHLMSRDDNDAFDSLYLLREPGPAFTDTDNVTWKARVAQASVGKWGERKTR